MFHNLKYSHKTILALKSFGPLKIASCDPVVLYNMFIIVIYQDDKCLSMPFNIYPEFTVKSLMFTEKNIFCLDDSSKLHYGTPVNASWEHVKFKTFPYAVLSFCILSEELLIIHKMMEDLLLTQHTPAKGFRKVKDTALDCEKLSNHSNFKISCYLISFFCSNFLSRTLNINVDNSNKESYIIFIHFEGKAFWLIYEEASCTKIKVNLLYEAVLPIHSIIALKNDILLVLRCGTLIFISTNDALFLNGSIENFDKITAALYIYTSEGQLYVIDIQNNSIAHMNCIRNLNNIHNVIISSNCGMIKMITDNKTFYSTDVQMMLSLEMQPKELHLMLPKELENTKNLVACLKNEVLKNEASIDKITIEKHLILLSMLMIKMNVYEKTVKLMPNLYDNIQDMKTIFQSCLIFEPLSKILKVATSVLHIKIDFSLEFKVRFNEVNRVLTKSQGENHADIWNINLSLESSSRLKQISHRVHNLENLNIIISVEQMYPVLPVRLMSYLVLNYSDCQIVMCSNYTDLNIFDIATPQAANHTTIDERIVHLASRNVGSLYDFERDSPNHRSYSFRLSIHKDLMKNRDLFMKHFTNLISKRFQSQMKISDLLVGGYKHRCYVYDTEISLEITEDDIGGVYFEATCKSLILLKNVRSFLSRALRDIEKDTTVDPHLKVVEHANYARFENARRDLNERMLADTGYEDSVLRIFRKLNEDLFSRLPL